MKNFSNNSRFCFKEVKGPPAIVKEITKGWVSQGDYNKLIHTLKACTYIIQCSRGKVTTRQEWTIIYWKYCQLKCYSYCKYHNIRYPRWPQLYIPKCMHVWRFISTIPHTPLLCWPWPYINVHLKKIALKIVTRFAKTRNNPAFVEIQILTSLCSGCLKLCYAAISSLYYV